MLILTGSGQMQDGCRLSVQALAAMVAAEVLRAPETVAGPDSGSDSGHLAVGADSGG